jgi:dTDP-4-dehydrorhamnose 3,5-epimerase
MRILDTEIEGAKLICPKVFSDTRGRFFECFHQKAYSLLETVFVQDNFSVSQKNTLRGMHFSHQKKLVGVFLGKVFDVIVDLRKNSPTYKKWQGFILDDEKHHQLFIPQGCAHGFYVLSEKAHFFYKVSEYYDPKKEKEFTWNDEEIGIDWPTKNPILSNRDQRSPTLCQLEL